MIDSAGWFALLPLAVTPTAASGCLNADEITRAGLNRVLSSEDLLTPVADEHGAPR